MKLAIIAAIALALASTGTLAQETMTDHSGHAMPAMNDMPASSAAFLAVNDAMHSAMTMEMTGDADVDFIHGMIPHHQGAVDMARIVLEHGSDPEVRKLAQDVIAAQKSEIAWMRDWLAQKGISADN